MKYLLATAIAWAAATLPVCCNDISARIIIEDATGRHVYALNRPAQKPPGILRKTWDSVYRFPKRHPRYWRVGRWTGNVFLWACQVRAAIK